MGAVLPYACVCCLMHLCTNSSVVILPPAAVCYHSLPYMALKGMPLYVKMLNFRLKVQACRSDASG